MISVDGEVSSNQIVPEFSYCPDNSKTFFFDGGIIHFCGGQDSASVFNNSSLFGGEDGPQAHIRCICSEYKLVLWCWICNYRRGDQSLFQLFKCLLMYTLPQKCCFIGSESSERGSYVCPQTLAQIADKNWPSQETI